jgi:hypothetical protein
MAITGLQLVTDAMYASGALGADEAITDAEAQLCLRRLNRLMDSWNNLRSLLYEVATDSFTMTAGVASYSSALLTVAGRPLAIDSMYVRLNNIDWQIKDISAEEWSSIVYKPVQSVPRQCYIDYGYPDATFNFYPIPYAAFICFVNATKSLPNTVALATSIALPPGYEAALVDNLAVDICPSFGRQPSSTLLASALNSKEALSRTNFVPLEMDTPLGRKPDPSNGFIYKGF